MTFPVVIYPDVELVAVTALRTFLATRSEAYCQGVTVGTKIAPGVTPTRFLRVRRTGGRSASTVIDVARLDILIWHDAPDSRMALGQLVRGFLLSLIGTFAGVACYGGTDYATPQQMPDPSDDTKEIVMLTVNVSMRGVELA